MRCHAWSKKIFLLASVIGATLAAALTGCSTMESHKYLFWGEVVPEKPEILQDHWIDYGAFIPKDPALKMRRGKAGVLRFYKAKNLGRSIPVEGRLMVYVFRGDDEGVELTPPIAKLKIDTEQLTKQRKFDKKHGYSYHVWLDLGEIDLPEQNISILTVFMDTKTNEPVRSGITYTRIGGSPTTPVDSADGSKIEAIFTSPPTPESTKEAIPPEPSEIEIDGDFAWGNRGTPRLPTENSDDSSANSRFADYVQMERPPAAQNPSAPINSTIYNPSQQKKLTFDDLRSITGPTSPSGGYVSQGVINSDGSFKAQ